MFMNRFAGEIHRERKDLVGEMYVSSNGYILHGTYDVIGGHMDPDQAPGFDMQPKQGGHVSYLWRSEIKVGDMIIKGSHQNLIVVEHIDTGADRGYPNDSSGTLLFIAMHHIALERHAPRPKTV
jgi:hypothetical protein